MSRCDVVIPVHNAVHWVVWCLEELFAHASDEELGEVVLVDDRSTPESHQLLRELCARFPRARLVRNEGRPGFGGACNYGVSQTRSPYFVLLNSDCLITRRTLGKLVEACEADPRIGLICPLSNNSPVLTLPLRAGRSYWEMNALLEEAFAGRPMSDVVLEACTVVGNCLLFTRECWDAVGGFDPRWGTGYGEETDYQMRAMAKGFRGMVRIDTYVYHQGGASFRYDPEAIELQKKNLRLFMSTWGPEFQAFSERCAVHDPVQAAERALDALGPRPVRCDVLFVLPDISQEIGGVHAVIEICNHLLRHGVEARCAVVPDNGPPVPPHYREPLFFGLLPFESEEQWLLDSTVEAKQVAATLFSTSIPAFCFARARGIPLINFVQGYEFYFNNGIHWGAVEDSYAAADEVLTTSHWLEEGVRRHTPTTPMTRLPLGVNEYIFHPSLKAAPANGPLRLAVVLRSSSDKGQWVLLEVLDRLAAHEGVELTLLAANGHALPRAWRARPGTRFVPLPVERVKLGELLRDCDVLLDASFHEGLGLVPMEALACGVVPVVADSGGVRDFIRDGQTGRLISEVNQPERYVEAVLQLASDRVLLSHLRQGALTMARECSAQRCLDGYVRFFQERRARETAVARQEELLRVDHRSDGGLSLENQLERLPSGGVLACGGEEAPLVLPLPEAWSGKRVRLTLDVTRKALLALCPAGADHVSVPLRFGNGMRHRVIPRVRNVLGARASVLARRPERWLKLAASALDVALLRGTRHLLSAGRNELELDVPASGRWALLLLGAPSFLVHEARVDGVPITDSDWARWASPGSPVSGAEGVVLRASGDDPVVLLPEVGWERDSVHVLSLEVSAPTHTELQLFFQVEDGSGYSEERRISRRLRPGRNALVMVLDHPKLQGALRLDPGSHVGHYILHSLRVFRLPLGPRPWQIAADGGARSVIAA